MVRAFLARAVVASLVLGAAICLAGCASASHASLPPVIDQPTLPPSPTATATLPPATPTSVPTDSNSPHASGPLVAGLPHDYGMIVGAKGLVTASLHGAPYEYKIASGDRLNEIAHRFGYSNGDDVVKFNEVSTGNGSVLYVGRVLYLQAKE
ncbi:MAG: hypothetical protein QOH44_800 [Actinomycetota bacterium]|jgi:hypothetical protein|nr:hypothetical protein [Actinomycetota bacterium]MDQ1573241.1 hypothetical protein [Actinomycetota bacterium]